jgi:GAF domain
VVSGRPRAESDASSWREPTGAGASAGAEVTFSPRFGPAPLSLTPAICRRFAQMLDVDGLAVSLFRPDAWQVLCTSDGVAEVIEALQFELGEGPCITAAVTDEAVLVDLGTSRIWPLLGARARDAGYARLAGIPLPCADPRGALVLYSRTREGLGATTMRDATAVARAIANVWRQPHGWPPVSDDPAA